MPDLLLRKVLALLSPRDRRIAYGLFVMMLLAAGFEAVGVGFVMPFIAMATGSDRGDDVARTIGDWLGLHGSDRTIALGLLLVLVYVLKNGYLALTNYLQLRFIFTRQVQLQARLFAAYLRLPYASLLQRNSSELLRNVTEEARSVFNAVMISTFQILIEALVVCALAITVIIVEPVLAPFLLVVFAATALGFYAAIRRRTTETGKMKQHEHAEMIKRVQEAIESVKEIKTSETEPYFISLYDQSSRRFAEAARYHQWIKGVPTQIIEVLGIAGVVALILITMITRGSAGAALPSLAVFAAAALRLMPSLNRILGALTVVRHFAPAVDVVASELSSAEAAARPKRSDRAPARIAPLSTITFDDVSYTYPGASRSAVQGLRFEIRGGSQVALVGPSGSGKTTTVDLLLGLLEPTHGRVLANGAPIHDDLAAWHQRVAYIPQPAVILDDTIRANVAFGVPRDAADDDKVWRALDAAQLGEFVRSLPGGLDARAGERGSRFSGGQAQRLAIARALYRDADLLVMDEATSALDAETEAMVGEAIAALRGHKTVLLITHRLSSIRNCDQAILIVDGKLRQAASLQELLAESPEFAAMAAAGGAA